MTDHVAQAEDEEPLFLEADGDELFGIYTSATAPSRGVGVHLLWGAGSVNTTAGRARIEVNLARDLAARGFDVLRTDHPGVGESTGEVKEVDFAEPAVAEVRAAVAHLASRNEKVAVVANCFGGRNLIAAADELAQLDAVVLMSFPIQDHNHRVAVQLHRPPLRKLAANPRRWPQYLGRARGRYARLAADQARFTARKLAGKGPASAPAGRGVIPTVARWLDRGVPMLLLSGEGDDFHPDLCIALEGPFGELVARHPDLIDIVTSPVPLLSFKSVESQREATETIGAWFERRFAVVGSSSAPSPGV